jgi:hypothetical protein
MAVGLLLEKASEKKDVFRRIGVKNLDVAEATAVYLEPPKVIILI